MKAIINAKIIDNKKIIEDSYLLFDKKIVEIAKKLPPNIETIDAKGAYLSAGFIDIHIHGSAGADVMDATPEALQTISKSILQTGTTSFLATTMTMSSGEIEDALANIERYGDEVEGAKILGTHLEGPFLNPAKCGAQNPQYIQSANFELIEQYIDSIKMITLAPEMEGADEFMEYLQINYPNILLSIGHSDASFEETKDSFAKGVSHATHLFNAMNPLHHREPGIVGAVLGSDEVSCEIIADNIHIHPSFYNFLFRLKQEQLILVTDAMRAGCMRCGEYSLGGQNVIVQDGEARLESGQLAGSVLKLNEALKNFYEHSEVSLPELVDMVTRIPAKKLGLDIGELKEGYCADLVLFDDKFNILKAFVDGDLRYNGKKLKKGKIMNRGISIHIGLNYLDTEHYGSEVSPLGTCEQDAKDMQSIAISQNFKSSFMLLSENATREAVKSAIASASEELT
ncbi:N-acetylglucosamine-6-phosphate deacetylase, partial [Sulfurovum sp. bin170]|uniref:N-acetylglucosamine-6-phosphate deacetylase n=1 Tax=Sulfurovum sp. bin170 TaxID=2695268 RepID=UPI0013DFF7BC